MTELDEIDAELERRRLEAQQRIASSRKIARYVVGTTLAVVAGLLILFLSQYSERISMKKALLVVGIVVAVVALEVVALKFSSRRDKPWSDLAVSLIFILLLFGVLTAVI